MGESRNYICHERHVKEPNVGKQIVWRIFTSLFCTHCIYICCFLDLYCSKYCKHSLFWVFLYKQIKSSCKSSICFLKYCTLHTLHCSIDNHFLLWLLRNTVYFSQLLAVKYVNLVLWVKVYVAFDYLDILKILSVMWMKNKF